mmetsp:Transcript_20362/g.47604  ORF Transcript_20362/g.47604 Transcript_20362/m.47604 type:complete len:283 (-) Transcript_20362:183-1031(-)
MPRPRRHSGDQTGLGLPVATKRGRHDADNATTTRRTSARLNPAAGETDYQQSPNHAADDLPSAYVVEVSIQPGGARRWDRFVFESREKLVEWASREFTCSFGILCALNYGEDARLQVFHGPEVIHTEYFLPRVQWTLDGITVRFVEGSAAFAAGSLPTRREIEGRLHNCVPVDGGESVYEVCYPDDHEHCFCQKGNCRPLADCEAIEDPIDFFQEEECSRISVVFDLDGIPDLPTRGLRAGEVIDLGGDEQLMLGFQDMENGESPGQEWPYEPEPTLTKPCR